MSAGRPVGTAELVEVSHRAGTLRRRAERGPQPWSLNSELEDVDTAAVDLESGKSTGARTSAVQSFARRTACPPGPGDGKQSAHASDCGGGGRNRAIVIGSVDTRGYARPERPNGGLVGSRVGTRRAVSAGKGRGDRKPGADGLYPIDVYPGHDCTASLRGLLPRRSSGTVTRWRVCLLSVGTDRPGREGSVLAGRRHLDWLASQAIFAPRSTSVEAV